MSSAFLGMLFSGAAIAVVTVLLLILFGRVETTDADCGLAPMARRGPRGRVAGMPTVQLESDSELSTIHVVPGNRGWSVHAAGDVEPACVHENATEAQSAARRIAAGRGVNVIVLHDRYHRLHVTPVHASAGAHER